MASPLVHAILDVAAKAGDKGAAMGAIVDTMVDQGFSAEEVEATVWDLLTRRRLTPCGFTCRTIKRKITGGKYKLVRMYEFRLLPWSIDLDRQLELGLEAEP